MTDETDAPTNITEKEYETALYVLETLRDEILPEGAVTQRRVMNNAATAVDAERDLDYGNPTPDEPALTTRLALSEVVRSTPAVSPFNAGYDVVDVAVSVGELRIDWEDPEADSDDSLVADGRGGDEVEPQYDIAEPATPDELPDDCEVAGCEDDIENFPEAFPVPPELAYGGGEGRLVMCDHHYVAARILAYTKPEPPYVDVGLYQETTYYARALAAETFDIPSQEKVTAPQDVEEEDA